MVLGLRRKKSTSTLSGIFPDNAPIYTTSPRLEQQVTLALPTKLEDVVKAVHDTIPTHLPGSDEGQDEVRYFLFSILTLKEYNIARSSPQWVLETCMYWQWDGSRLRSLPLDAFQQLCPLAPGYATIDWGVKGSKYRQQMMPPCDVRDKIGTLIKRVVTRLKARGTGNRGPGWQESDDLKKSLGALPGGMTKMQGSAPPVDRRSLMPSFATFPGYFVPQPFYSISNQALPSLHHMPPVGDQQNPLYMRHQIPFAGSPYGMPGAGPVPIRLSPECSAWSVPDGKACDQSSLPASSPASPTSSYCQTESMSSRLSESTTITSHLSSESEPNFWSLETDRPRLITRRITDDSYTPPGTYQASNQRASTAKPNRYKTVVMPSATQNNSRSYDLARRKANLHSESYSNTSTMYAPSEPSLTPFDSGTNKYGSRLDSAMPPEMMQSASRRHSSFYPTISSNISGLSTTGSYVTATRYARPATASITEGFTLPRLGSATPTMHSPTSLARPMNNFKVDAYALDSAEHVGLESRPGPMRVLMTEAERNRTLARSKSKSKVNQRLNKFFDNTRGEEEFVRPSMRFKNPRTGQPRLTIYGTIEEKEKLGKQKVESQRRVEM